jgi:hypothetical protein
MPVPGLRYMGMLSCITTTNQVQGRGDWGSSDGPKLLEDSKPVVTENDHDEASFAELADLSTWI